MAQDCTARSEGSIHKAVSALSEEISRLQSNTNDLAKRLDPILAQDKTIAECAVATKEATTADCRCDFATTIQTMKNLVAGQASLIASITNRVDL